MDSRLIYAASERMTSHIVWTKETETEWIYFGADKDVNLEKVSKIIDGHFSESILLVCWTRQGSFETNKDDILITTRNILGYHDFVIWNSSFDHAIEFNKIGVLRCGQVGS